MEQLLINMSALCLSLSSFFFFYSPSVEEEEEDEELMETKPGPESEQQDEDDNRETKEGKTSLATKKTPIHLMKPQNKLPILFLMCVTPFSGQWVDQIGGWGQVSAYQDHGILGSALIKNLSLDPVRLQSEEEWRSVCTCMHVPVCGSPRKKT